MRGLKFSGIACTCSSALNFNNRRVFLAGSVAAFANSLLPKSAYGQSLWSGSLSEACSFYGDLEDEDIYTFASNKDAEDVVGKITNAVGLPLNFKINAANVPNALAVIKDKDRIILYSESFMSSLQEKSGTEWASWTILAHEVGHHLSGHTLLETGSRPALELQADRFAGFAVGRMNATLDQAQACFKGIGTKGSPTHPGRSARLEAVTVGWKQAQSGEKTSLGTKPPPIQQPPPGLPLPSNTNPTQTMTWIIEALANNNLNISMLSPPVAGYYNQQRFMIAQRMQFAGLLQQVVILNQSILPDGSMSYAFGARFLSTGMTFNLVINNSGTINHLSIQ